MKKRFVVAFCVVFCLLNTFVQAQMENLKLYNISREEGLPSENVQQVFEDSFGFLWIASFDGLYRWDGSTYKQYHSIPADSHSLSNNIVYVVFEDFSKRLWIGTLSGLDYYNRETDNFEHCAFDKNHAKIAVNALVEDSRHQLWIGASSGLFLYDYQTKKSIRFNNGLTDHVVFGMDIDSRDNLWIGTFHGGVNKFSIKDRRVTAFTHQQDNAQSICSNRINAVRVDHRDRVWIGSYDKGISVLSPEGQVTEHYQIDPARKIQNIISSIYEDKQHRIWVGAIKERPHYLDAGANRLRPFLNSANKKTNSRCESVTHVSEDSFDNLWICTQTEGMFYTNKRKNVFEYYANDDRNSAGLSGKIITCFSQARNGNVWIGSSGGLTVLDPRSRAMRSYTTADGLVSNDIYDVKEDARGDLWIAAWNGGVTRFNPATKKITTFLHDNNNPNSLNFNNVKTLLPEDSIVWIGTHGEGLAVYDIRRNKFIHAGNNSVFPFDMHKPAWINYLMRDSKNRIWISTFNGIFLYDRKSLRHFSHSDDASPSLSSNAINMTVEGDDGKIYSLSEKGGVDVFEEDRQNFSFVVQAMQGAKAFTFDQRGRLWISSNNGIASVDLSTKKLKRFDSSDGLIANSFFQKSVLRSASGQLYFGSIYGFNRFHPDSIKTTNFQIRPYLTSLYIYDSLVLPRIKGVDKVLSLRDTIELSYKEPFFTIGFSATNLMSGDKMEFSYKLEGLHDTWIGLTDERQASFTNLDPGTYIFRLRYTDANDVWVEWPESLTMVIYPPWWLTTWFKTISVAGALAIVLLIFYVRINSVRKQNRFLEQEVCKRTAELSHANAYLTERNAEVNRQSEKILVQQQHIIVQNRQLEKSVDEARRLNQVKDRFFSILAHDLKNPIHTMISMCERLTLDMQNLTRRDFERYVDSLRRSSTGIHTLLTNLLHWGETHTRRAENSPTDFSVAELIRNNAQLLEPQFQQKNITVTILANTSHLVFADYNMVDTVIRNLLTNSAKFTYPHGEVTIESMEVEEEIVIRVSDDGKGMSNEQVENIFNIEKQDLSKGTSGETGTGLGLIISREFIEANKGSITLVSELNKGSVFSIRLPKSHAVKRENADYREVLRKEFGGESEELDYDKVIKIRGKKILIVEDNQELRTQLQLYLSSSFEIFDASNGREGLLKAIEIQPSIIISDLIMPVMNGEQFCREVKGHADLQHIPFILLTSNSSEESQLSGYGAGADVYLTKPVKKRLLFQVILNCMENQERLRQRMLETNGLITSEPGVNKSEMEFIARVVEIIEANMEDSGLDFKLITQSLAMSKTVVYNKLKTITGLGIQEFIKSVRLKRSLKYLSEGRMAVNEVAQKTGFSSQSYFNKCFVKQFNMTPKAYMNKNRKPVAL